MVNGCPNAAWRHVARVLHGGTLTGLSDREVLERFVESRDESAFEVLLTRHGPMVLNVCRRLLREPHDVEDAFQAAFLVLVRKAGSIRVEGSLGPWLYTVATRTAARARADRRLKQGREFSGGDLPEIANDVDLASLEVPRVVQEELSQLPERFRNPLILCYLQGLTHESAARQLGCPVGTVRSRLARARALLRKRFVRRGLSLSAAAISTTIESNAKAAVVPPHVRMSLIKVATGCISESSSIAGGFGVTPSVAALVEGVLYVMQIKRLAIVGMALLSVVALVSVVGVTTFSAAGQPGDKVVTQPETKTERAGEKRSAEPEPATFAKTYYVGDIIGADRPRNRPIRSAPGVAVQPMVNLDPLIKLIALTVAPGTWRIQDSSGAEVRLDSGRKSTVRKQGDTIGLTRSPGTITPFFLDLSLIVRCTEETHEQVAILLRGLREFHAARDGQTEYPQQDERSKSPQRPAKSATLTAPRTPTAVLPAEAGSKQRIRQLLDQLTEEIAKLTPVEDPTVGP